MKTSSSKSTGDKTPRELLEESDALMAKIAQGALFLSLKVFANSDANKLIAHLESHPAQHVDLLSKSPQTCNTIMEFSQKGFGVPSGLVSVSDTFTIHDTAALVELVSRSYEENGASEELLTILNDTHEKIFQRFLYASSEQATILKKFLLSIADYLSTLKLTGSRLILVELPIGNSLPIAVLKSILPPQIRAVDLTVSLSRNDSKKRGIRRIDLLREKIYEIGPVSSDIFLYLDEWNTGINFNVICGHIEKILQEHGAHFLPCAMLSEKASIHPRFEKFRKQHDKRLEGMSCSGNDFRMQFPRLRPQVDHDRPFFWSESDRIGGWRKFQFLGSMISSIEAALAELSNNQDSLNKAVATHLAESLREHQLTKASTPNQIFRAAVRLFEEDKAALDRNWSAIQRLSDEFAPGGEVGDFEELMQLQGRIFERAGLGNNFALGIALTYILRFENFDPTDRYYFRHHAPSLLRLSGRMQKQHTMAIEFITKVVNQ